MDSFELDMGNALQEVNGNEQIKGHSKMDQEAASLARSKGWAAPETYDYSKYVTPEGAPAPPAQEVEEGEFPAWAAKAAKYEWKDEYGDVGPQSPDLEKMLFHSDFINRTGLKIGK